MRDASAAPSRTCRVRVCRDCCCGTTGKHPDTDHDDLLGRLIEGALGSADVSVSTCLLACERSNIVVVCPSTVGRSAGGRPVWLKWVLDPATVDAIAAWLRRGGPGLSEVPVDLRPLVTGPGLAVAWSGRG